MVRYLFPYSLKLPGAILLFLSISGGIIYLLFDSYELKFLDFPAFGFSNDSFFSSKTNNLTDEILSFGIIVGALLTGFSRQKTEDEYINQIRLESLLWAVYINYAILLISIFFISGLNFLNVMLYNLFTILIIFVIRFYLVLLLKKRSGND